MKYIGIIIGFILLTAVYWVPIAIGIVAVLDGYLIGVLFIALGLWLAFRA